MEKLQTIEKLRLFVDMDGTLTVFIPQKSVEPLYEEGYFINLPPHENVIESVMTENRKSWLKALLIL